ncbi:MAG TPA: LptF/LptG family permease [Candidatus Kapabacteria bacterium]|nr:LptF/LptG family permease [Candidatus Kapabacteria bacterium]
MDRIDRYILRQFVLTFLFGILAFVVIYIAVDLMEHLDDFFDAPVKMTTWVIIEYYLYSVPDIVQLVVPIAMLLASLFTMGRLDTTHELTAVRAAGRSLPRTALPLFGFALLVSLGMLYFDGWIVPMSNKGKGAIDRKYLGRGFSGGAQDIYTRLSPTMNMTIDYFDASSSAATNVSIERFDTTAPVTFTRITGRSGSGLAQETDTSIAIRITERIDAATMRYDSTRRLWTLHDGIARNLADPLKVVVTTFDERPMPGIPLTPRELDQSQQNVGELTIPEFRDRIDRERIGGREINRLLVDYYARYAFPFSALIVVFFGIPASGGQRKGGAAITVAITALVSAIYLVLTEVSKAFSYGADFPPLLTAWMANLVFTIFGVANLFRAARR